MRSHSTSARPLAVCGSDGKLRSLTMSRLPPLVATAACTHTHTHTPVIRVSYVRTVLAYTLGKSAPYAGREKVVVLL